RTIRAMRSVAVLTKDLIPRFELWSAVPWHRFVDRGLPRPPAASRRTPKLRRAQRRRPEPDRRQDPKDNKQQQNGQLRDQEWRLRLLGGHRFEGRNLLERLYDSDKTIEIEGNHCGDHIDPAPGTAKLEGIARKESDRENHQRYRAHNMRRPDLMDGESESRHAGCDRGRQKDRRPEFEPFASQEPEQRDESCGDRHQADDNVDKSERCCAHAPDHWTLLRFAP